MFYNKYVHLGCLATQVFFTSGILFGWAALNVKLLEEGVYDEFCEEGSEYFEKSRTDDDRCIPQLERYNFIFTLNASIHAGLSLPWGRLTDSCGPLFCTIIGGVLGVIGVLITALAEPNEMAERSEGFDNYLYGMLIWTLGSGGIVFPAMKFSSYFAEENQQSLVLAIINGAFDSSTLIFYLFQISGQSLADMFSGLSILSAVLTLVNVFMWYRLIRLENTVTHWLCCVRETATIDNENCDTVPQDGVKMTQLGSYREHSIPSKLLPDVNDTDSNITADTDNDDAQIERERDDDANDITIKNNNGGVALNEIQFHREDENKEAKAASEMQVIEMASDQEETKEGEDQGLSEFERLLKADFKGQFFSPQYWYFVVFASIMVLRMNTFMGTAVEHLKIIDEGGDTYLVYVEVLSLALPLSFPFIPVVGWLLDNRPLWYSIFAILSMNVIALSCMLVSKLWVQIFSFLCFTMFRTWFYSFLGSYFVVVFGYAYFGQLLGLVFCMAGIVNLLQYPLLLWVHHDDTFTYLHIMFLAMGLVLFLFCWYVKEYERQRPYRVSQDKTEPDETLEEGRN